MTRSHLKQPTPEERDRILTGALLRAADILKLSQADLAEILGESEATISRTAQGRRAISENSKPGELAVMLLRIFRNLDSIVGGKEVAVRHWFRTENGHLGGTPAFLVKRVEGLSNVCSYLDALRGKV